MSDPNDIQEEVIQGFRDAGEAFEQFDHLLQLAAEPDELSDEEKIPEVLVDGCQSQVWLYMDWLGTTGKNFRIRADSDTLMVRGVIRMFELMFNGQDAQAIIDCPIRFVDETELIYIFDSQRQSGVASIAGRIRDFAQRAITD